MCNIKKTQIVVIGSGPGGYSAAFRCADLGMDTTIVERYPTLGGVCLNVGCIPSKTLLHITNIISDINILHTQGVIDQKINFNINQIRIRKINIIKQLTHNLKKMADMRNVKIINGHGTFIDQNNINVKNSTNNTKISFEHAIIAAGSQAITLPFIPNNDTRIWNSTDALTLQSIPKQLLIIGAGIIGLEIATIYSTLGSEIDIIEMLDQPIVNIDSDIIKIFIQCTKTKFNIFLETQVTMVEAQTDGIYVTTENKQLSKNKKRYDAIIVAVGRLPNSQLLNAHHAQININKFGFISVDNQMRTNIPNIFAIGDIVGPPMLAHKSIHEGHIAAEVISGKNTYFDPKVIPSVIYTEPEIAWIGFTEKTAKEQGIDYETVNFPWTASGRAITADAQKGLTKLIFNKKTHRIIGGTIIGKHASELLGEIGLAIEMGCDAEDIALTIHAHPSLHETIGLAASIYTGSITDLPNKKSKINMNLYS